MTDLKPCPTCGRAEPTVKPLVWEGDGYYRSEDGQNDGWLEEANTPFGWGYSVEFGRNGSWVVDCTFGDVEGEFDNPDAAKIAAQADFERRVKECLV